MFTWSTMQSAFTVDWIENKLCFIRDMNQSSNSTSVDLEWQQLGCRDQRRSRLSWITGRTMPPSLMRCSYFIDALLSSCMWKPNIRRRSPRWRPGVVAHVLLVESDALKPSNGSRWRSWRYVCKFKFKTLTGATDVLTKIVCLFDQIRIYCWLNVFLQHWGVLNPTHLF